MRLTVWCPVWWKYKTSVKKIRRIMTYYSIFVENCAFSKYIHFTIVIPINMIDNLKIEGLSEIPNPVKHHLMKRQPLNQCKKFSKAMESISIKTCLYPKRMQ